MKRAWLDQHRSPKGKWSPRSGSTGLKLRTVAKPTDAVPDQSSASTLIARLSRAAAQRGYTVFNMGRVDDLPVLLLTPPENPQKPRALIVAGLHGDEPAGPLAVAEVLENMPDRLLRARDVSFMPLASPGGFARNTRDDARGYNPNRGWRSGYGPTGPVPQLLRPGMDRMVALAGGRVLTLHEDDTFDGEAYVYFSRNADALARAMLDVVSPWFAPLPDGKYPTCGTVEAGLVKAAKDGTIEDVFQAKGIPTVLTTESPGRAPLDARVRANCAWIETFIRT